jgi:hypothetical protein
MTMTTTTGVMTMTTESPQERPTEPVATVDPERRTVSIQFAVPRVGPRLRSWRNETSRSVRGIRGRVVLGYVLLVAGALVLSLLVVRQVLLVRTDQQIEDALVQEVEELRILADGTDPETGEPFGSDVAAIFDVFLARNVPADGEVLLTVVGGEPYKETLGAPSIWPRMPRWSSGGRRSRSRCGSMSGPATRRRGHSLSRCSTTRAASRASSSSCSSPPTRSARSTRRCGSSVGSASWCWSWPPWWPWRWRAVSCGPCESSRARHGGCPTTT